MSPHNRSLPVYIFLFALVVRISLLIATYESSAAVESYEDVQIATNLLDGKGYVYGSPWGLGPVRPTAAKAPVYPLVVMTVFWVFGAGNFFALFVLHAFLSSLTCSFLYLSLEAAVSQRAREIAGFGLAAYPPFVYHAVTSPEASTLLLVLLAAFFYQLLRLHRAPSLRHCTHAGVTAGVLVLTDPVTVPFVGIAFVYVAYATRDTAWATLGRVTTVSLVIAAMVGPWMVRNYAVFGQVVFVKSNFGWTLVDGLSQSGVDFPVAPGAAELEGLNEAAENDRILATAKQWIRDHRSRYRQFILDNVQEFWWEPDRYRNNSSWSYIMGRRLPYLMLLAASVPGILLALVEIVSRKPRGIGHHVFEILGFALMVTYTAVYAAVGAFLLRYHFPIEFVLFGFLGRSASHLVSLIRHG